MIDNNVKDNPTIPVISPAFPNLLSFFLIPLLPNIIANIPVGNDIIKRQQKTIETIPNGNEAIPNEDLFLFSNSDITILL